jgi:hypothetical protein
VRDACGSASTAAAISSFFSCGNGECIVAGDRQSYVNVCRYNSSNILINTETVSLKYSTITGMMAINARNFNPGISFRFPGVSRPRPTPGVRTALYPRSRGDGAAALIPLAGAASPPKKGDDRFCNRIAAVKLPFSASEPFADLRGR